jgi:phosphoribosylformylglycinamidine synthase
VLDLERHRVVLDVMRTLASGPSLAGAHDVSDGGLAVALAEMAVRSGVGFSVRGVTDHVALFSESPSRVVLCVEPAHVGAVVDAVTAAGVAVTELGRAGGDRLVVEGLVDVPLAVAARAWRKLPAALSVG